MNDYESQNEEWLGLYKKNLNNANVPVTIATGACRIGALSLASSKSECANALLRHTMQEMDIDATSRTYLSRLERLAPQQEQPQTWDSNNKLPPTTQIDADVFFEEYSECMKPGINAKEEESDGDSDSEDEVQITKVRPRKETKTRRKDEQGMHEKRTFYPRGCDQQNNGSTGQPNLKNHSQEAANVVNNPYQKRSQPSLAPAPTANPNKISSSNNQNSNRGSNSFTYSPVTQAAVGADSWGNQPISNSGSNTNSFNQKPQHQPRFPANNNNYATTVSTSDRYSSWESHQNQQNPFQTAREVAQMEESENNNHHRQNHQHTNSNWNIQQQQPQQSNNTYSAHHPPSANHNPYVGHYPPPQQDESVKRGGPSIPDSLKRKFQPPRRVEGPQTGGDAGKQNTNRGSVPFPNRSGGGVQIKRPSSSSGRNSKSNSNNKGEDDEEELPEELQHLDKELVKKIQNEIMETGDSVTFDDIAGLYDAKQTVQEVVCWPMKRPDLFTGLRRAPNGLLLYGPPGTGKTLIGKAIAHESGATFFSISSSSLTSKWIGEGEKLVRVLFAVAAYQEPAVVFIDEIDSLLTQRTATENEASRRIKTEFLVQLDGTGTSSQGRVLVIGATNRPQELDEAARRRFTKRLYIPLPNEQDRSALLNVTLKKNKHRLTDSDVLRLAKETEGFSGADLKALCTDAAMGPIRQLGSRALSVAAEDIPPISFKHFKRSLKGTRPSVAPADLLLYEEFTKAYGTKRSEEDDDDDSSYDDE